MYLLNFIIPRARRSSPFRPVFDPPFPNGFWEMAQEDVYEGAVKQSDLLRLILAELRGLRGA
jgi:hypothetical protein